MRLSQALLRAALSPRATAVAVSLALITAVLVSFTVDSAESSRKERLELVEKRTQTSKTYRNSNGSLTTALYSTPVHYRAGDGAFRPIDSRLVRESATAGGLNDIGIGGDYTYENAANGFDVRFKSELTEDFMQFGAGGERFTMSMLGTAQPEASATDTGLEYAGVMPATDLRYELSATGTKEALVLRNKRAPSRFRFLVKPEGDPRAVRARERADGSWAFFAGGQATPLFALQRPAAAEFKPAPDGAADPALTAPMGADNAELEVSRARGGFLVELQVNRRWLRAKKRNFPIVVDPTLTFQPGDSRSLTMQGDCPDCWTWEGGYIEVGTHTNSVRRGAIQFDVGMIPPTATVTNATMRLESSHNNCIHTPSTNNGEDCELQGHTIDFHRMTADWTWPQTKDIHFEATPAHTWTIPQGSIGMAPWSPVVNITADVADWVAGTKPNYGYLVKRSTEPYGASGPIFMGTLYTGPQQREPKLEVTYTADASRFNKPTSLHSNGAELSWTRFDGSTGNAFSKYEVHRSETAGFTPSESTRLTTISDPSVTEFRDTTAAPGRAFSYKIVTNGQASVEHRVTLPADGKGQITYQGAQGEGTSTFIQDLGTATGCENFGRSDELVIGGRDDYTNEGSARALFAFDLHDIPAGAAIDSATLRLWTNGKPSITTTANIHRATRAWSEGSGYHGEGLGFYNPVCTGDGASWKLSDGQSAWSTPGGDFDPTVVDSATHPANTRTEANFNVASVVRDWADGKAPNFGFLVKAADETTFANGLHYASDDYATVPTQRPKLTVTYADGSDSKGPEVALGRPAGGDRVSGTVAVDATATDDRRVDSAEFLVDGVVKGSDNSAPYSFSWNTTTSSNGSHNLTVRATDDVGNQTTTAPVSVEVANSAPPTTAVTYPTRTYQDQVKGHVPNAYWRLGETSGTTAADASGNGKNGTYGNAYTLGLTGLVTGNTDKAVQLRTSNKPGRVVVTGLSGQLGSNLTAEALVNWTAPTSNSTYNRVLARNWGSAGGWLLAVRKSSTGQNQAYFAVNKAGAVTELTTAVTPGRMHLAGTYDGATLRLFVNGVEATSAALASASLNTSASVIAGDVIASNTTVDEAAVYGAALKHYELKSHWEVANERDPTIGGQAKVTASAGDDGTVDKVEFYVDGNLFGSDSTAPYEATLDTQSTTMPIYDGQHTLTTKAYDNHGQVTESSPFTVVVDNAGKSRYVATLSSTAVPPAVEYEPGAGSQQQHGLDVTVTNKSTETWSASDIVLRYRWFSPDPPPDGPTITNGPEVALGTALAPNAQVTKTVMVEPPVLPDGVDKAQYRLQVDLYEKSMTRWFADRGNAPLENPVIVNKKLLTALGLERWLQYDGAALGAGMTHLLNVANGNSIVRWSPFSAPGRGLATNVNLTYNALEKKSESPVGNNFSLSISSLSRFGNPIDIHPNKADEIAGRANRFVELTDGDGTTHRFIGKQHTDGTVYWEEPDGVHLFLWNPPGSDPARKWAFTRPDDVTFFYDEDGFPTSVEDKNGNKLTFTLENTPPAEDPGGPKKRITAVTDAAGQGAGAAPNRTFNISYYSKQNAKSPHVRGTIRRITDHNGSALDFDYYDDGNLLRLTQRGGTKADGSPLPDRSFVFTYTDSPGNGPAIPLEADRRSPDTKIGNQSTRLYSVRQPRTLANRAQEETIFTYLGSGAGNDRWKLASRKDRAGATTNYSYSITTQTTTVALPEGQPGQSRTSKFVYDNQGKITKITDPRNEDTLVAWTPDRHVEKVTFQPTGKFTQYGYNANGYLTQAVNELGETTKLYYQDRAVTGVDSTSYWKAGRTIPHLSLLARLETPKGVATASPTDDFDWNFTYDAAGNLDTVEDPEGAVTDYATNPDGTTASITDALGHRTTFPTYDANGLPTKIVEGTKTKPESEDPSPLAERTTLLQHTDDGLLEWLEDPNHVGEFDSLPGEERRTYFFYDSFHRLGKQTTPSSTALERGKLIVSSAQYDANDNLVSEVDPSYNREQLDHVLTTTADFDAMDRPISITETDTDPVTANETTTFEYDAAGRSTKVKLPRGQAGPANAHATEFKYDALDRISRETRYRFEAGSLAETLHRHFCYDQASDLAAIVQPKEGLDAVDCANVAALDHVMEFDYDAAHRLTSMTNAEGHAAQQTYDANGNVDLQTDPAGKKVDFVYDERDMVTEIIQDAELPGQAQITTAYRYNKVGNIEERVTPRAFDIHGPREDYAGLDYVEQYTYDSLDRLVKTAFPKHANAGQVDDTPASYQYRDYDDNGNLTTLSLPTTATSLSTVAAEDRTDFTHFDPGWVASSNDHVVAPVEYGYTAKGQQARMAPEGTTRERRWTYFADGPVREERDFRRDGVDGKITYGYDLNDNLTSVSDTTGLTQTTQTKRLDITASYDGLDRLTKSTDREGGGTPWSATTYTWDRNGNLIERIDDINESDSGLDNATGRKHVFTYDRADRLDTHTDYGENRTAASDDRLITTTWTPTDLLDVRRIRKWDGSGFGNHKQMTDRDWSANGLLTSLRTYKGDGSAAGDADLLESHALTYTDPAGVFLNGHKTKDVFRLKGPNADCTSADCTATLLYDARDRLVQENRGHGAEPARRYWLLPTGSVEKEELLNQAGGVVRTERFEYDGTKLAKQEVGSVQSWYFYDCFGNLDIVRTAAHQEARDDCSVKPTNGNVVADYEYDDFDRLERYEFRAGTGSLKDETTYVYDALDRPREIDEHHETAPTTSRRVLFDYVGLTTNVASERHFKVENQVEALKRTKSYTYDALGNRIGMTDARQGGPTKDYGYASDPQGSISLLIDDAGQAQAAYGYFAYGEADEGLTKELNPDFGEQGQPQTTPSQEPFNPYRYTGKRLDTGSAVPTGEQSGGAWVAGQGTLDMGARRFGPDVSGFLQRDAYASALADVGLSLDPLTQNRYALAGGNPISFVEVDGHSYTCLSEHCSGGPYNNTSGGGGGGGANSIAGAGGGGGGSAGGGSVPLGPPAPGRSAPGPFPTPSYPVVTERTPDDPSFLEQAVDTVNIVDLEVHTGCNWLSSGCQAVSLFDNDLEDAGLTAISGIAGGAGGRVLTKLAEKYAPGALRALGRLADETGSVGGSAGRSAFGDLAHASHGIRPYAQQARVTAGQRGNIQAHHLLEKRFARRIGGNPRQWPAIVTTRAEHQAFTNAWQRAIPYGAGTRTASRAQIEAAASRIYAGYPEILKALRLP